MKHFFETFFFAKVFVSDNDIYWIESIDRPNAVRVTSTGEDKILFNGIPDWVYEGNGNDLSISQFLSEVINSLKFVSK